MVSGKTSGRGKLQVASQLPQGFNTLMNGRAPGVTFVPLASGAFEAVPAGVRVLIPSPVDADPTPPMGWPFDVEWVHLISTGWDSYPEWMLSAPKVTYSPGVSGVSLAEFSLAAIFAAAKRLPELWIDTADKWTRSSVSLVTGSKLGIVGFGEIGQALAKRALALGMKVQALRRSAQPLPRNVERAASLTELFAANDHVVLTAPGTPETFHMVNRELLAAAKPGLHIINVGRGTLIDNDALVEALDSGKIGRATLDVTEPEPLPAGHRFYTHPQIYLTPHTGSFDRGAGDRIAAIFAGNVRRFLRDKPMLNIVDRARGY